MTDIRLWDGLENFSGTSAALIRDDEDKVHVSICHKADNTAPGTYAGTYALTDEEWIRWQSVIETAPAVLRTLTELLDKAKAYDDRLNGTEEKRWEDSRSPDGDDYNELLGMIEQARAELAKALPSSDSGEGKENSA